jgi:hypothetical protein
MKAIEAPEKIYISTTSQDSTYYISNQYKRLVEYTRTDAFIEKATSYIQQHWIWNTKMIEDFKNYMKEDKL